MQRADFKIGSGGNTNFAKFIEHSNSASGNTSNILADKIKVGTSTVDFSDTLVQWKYAASSADNTFTLTDSTEGSADYVVFSPDQNYELIDQKRLIYGANGSFRIKAEMTSANSHVSPVIDLDRLNVVSIENNIDNGGIQDSDISITSRGSNYANVMQTSPTIGAYSANVSGGGTTNNATIMAQVEMTLNCASNTTSLLSANSGYEVSNEKPAQFVVGEAVMCNTSGANLSLIHI